MNAFDKAELALEQYLREHPQEVAEELAKLRRESTGKDFNNYLESYQMHLMVVGCP